MSYEYLGKLQDGNSTTESFVSSSTILSTPPTISPTPISTATLKNTIANKRPAPDDQSLPHAFRSSRPLYPREIAYIKDIFGPSLRYDKIRITRDHWFSMGSTRVTGNTINFTSYYGGLPLFEASEEEQLTPAGLDLLGHEAMHVWQYQNGGWAYASESLIKQAAGYYSTGSRSTAYDWAAAVEWDIPWEKWGPEQQAQAIDDWNLALRSNKNKDLVEKLQPYVDKVQGGVGAAQFSLVGTIIVAGALSGIGYLWKGQLGIQCGLIIGVLLNLPWNKWFLKKADII